MAGSAGVIPGFPPSFPISPPSFPLSFPVIPAKAGIQRLADEWLEERGRLARRAARKRGAPSP